MSATATERMRAHLGDSEMAGVFEEALREATAELAGAVADVVRIFRQSDGQDVTHDLRAAGAINRAAAALAKAGGEG